MPTAQPIILYNKLKYHIFRLVYILRENELNTILKIIIHRLLRPRKNFYFIFQNSKIAIQVSSVILNDVIRTQVWYIIAECL